MFAPAQIDTWFSLGSMPEFVTHIVTICVRLCQIVSQYVTQYCHNMCQIVSQYVSDIVTICVRYCHNMCQILSQYVSDCVTICVMYYIWLSEYSPHSWNGLQRWLIIQSSSISDHFTSFNPPAARFGDHLERADKRKTKISYIIFYFVTWCNTFYSKYQLYRKTELALSLVIPVTNSLFRSPSVIELLKLSQYPNKIELNK